VNGHIAAIETHPSIGTVVYQLTCREASDIGGNAGDKLQQCKGDLTYQAIAQPMCLWNAS
jgi:hypothetical protein